MQSAFDLIILDPREELADYSSKRTRRTYKYQIADCVVLSLDLENSLENDTLLNSNCKGIRLSLLKSLLLGHGIHFGTEIRYKTLVFRVRSIASNNHRAHDACNGKAVFKLGRKTQVMINGDDNSVSAEFSKDVLSILPEITINSVNIQSFLNKFAETKSATKSKTSKSKSLLVDTNSRTGLYPMINNVVNDIVLVTNRVYTSFELCAVLQRAISLQSCTVYIDDFGSWCKENLEFICVIADFIEYLQGNHTGTSSRINVIARIDSTLVKGDISYLSNIFTDRISIPLPSYSERKDIIELMKIRSLCLAKVEADFLSTKLSKFPVLELINYVYNYDGKGSRLKHNTDIIGLVDAKDAIDEAVLWPRLFSNLYSHMFRFDESQSHESHDGAISNSKKTNIMYSGTGAITGIMLYGPPGTGKTLLVKETSSALGCQLITMKISDLVQGEIGSGEAALRNAFQEAKRLAPSILFFDEFQAIFTNRSGGSDNDDSTKTLSTTLAGCFDDLNIWNRMVGLDNLVTIIGATNEPWAIDRGFLRAGRFDRSIYVGCLSDNSKIKFLNDCIKETISETDVQDILRKTNNFSGADFSLLFRKAKSYCKGRNIELSHFLTVLNSMKATTSPGEFRKFKRWGKLYSN